MFWQNGQMKLFDDSDDLRSFLRTIETYDQFWERKEPDLHDAAMKAAFDEMIRDGHDPQSLLRCLKNEVVRDFCAESEARLPDRVH